MEGLITKMVNCKNKAAKGLKAFWQDESGMGTVEVILIIVVLIGLVIIFKKQITAIVNDVFKAIEEETRAVTG